MKKNLRIFCFLLLLIVFHETVYAAFPIKNISVAATSKNAQETEKTNTDEAEQSRSFRLLTRLDNHFHHYRSQQPKYRSLAILYCIVCFGLHRLYLGYTFSGIIQLIAEPLAIAMLLVFGYFGDTFILSYFLYYCAAVLVWQIWDLIRLIRGSLNPKHGYYTNDHRFWRRHGVREGM